MFQKRVSESLALGIVLLATSWPCWAQASGASLVVWDFDHSLTNRLGGGYNAYSRLPSSSRTYLDSQARLAGSRHSLRITAHRDNLGFCGVWLEFYPGSDSPQRYLDASRFRFLSFWMKGARGGEQFEITLKDDTAQQHEDTNPTVTLRSYLPLGAFPVWKQVLIPLVDFQGLNPSRLASLTISFVTPGDNRVYLDDIGFANSGGERQAPGNALGTAAASGTTQLSHALWVWNTSELVDASHPANSERFFDFCARQGIGQVFFSLDLGRPADSLDDEPHFEFPEAEAYRTFLVKAHNKHLQVDALAGTPDWAAKVNRAQALAVVDAVLEFNRTSPPPGRFDGIHFDVEPYLLIGYAAPALRGAILKSFLEMVAQCAERAKAQGHLRFGNDVPAWFYAADESTRRELSVEFGGRTKPVGEHLSDLLDTVTIMDYRNEADGAGGIVQFGRPALEYAARTGKKIQVGLETFLEPESSTHFVCGASFDEFRKRAEKSDLANKLFVGDFRLVAYADTASVHVGLTAPEGMQGSTAMAFYRALSLVSRDFGGCGKDGKANDQILERAHAALARDPEWKGFERFEIPNPSNGEKIVGFHTRHIMLPKITFHGLGRGSFEEETRSVVEWFSTYASFAGLAIHFYESYRDIVDGPLPGAFPSNAPAR